MKDTIVRRTLVLLVAVALLGACRSQPADTSAHQKSEAEKSHQELSTEIEKQRKSN